MECKKCGAMIPDEEEICSVCGYSSVEEETIDEINDFLEVSDDDEEILEFVVEDSDEEEDSDSFDSAVDFFKETPEKKTSKLKQILLLSGCGLLLVAITVAICAVVFKNVYQGRVVYVSATQIAAEGNVDKKGRKTNVAELSGYPITLEEYKIFLGNTYITYAATATEEDWAQEIDGKPLFQDMKDNIYKQMLEIYTIAEDARKSGVTATAEDIEGAKESLLGQTGLTADKFVVECGSTVEALELAAENLALARVHYQAFDEKVTSSIGEFAEEDINKIIEEKYLHAKHILISKNDAEGNPLSDEEIANKKALAEKILAEVNETNFDELMKKHTEDPGSESSPNGYFFTEGQMVPEFENAVKSLEINKISGIVESDYGYHIIIRLPLDFDKESQDYQYAKYVAESILTQDAYELKLEEMRKEWGFKENKKAIDNIKKY